MSSPDNPLPDPSSCEFSRVIFVVNPAAGRGRARAELVPLRQHLSDREIEAEIFLTQAPGDATRLLEGLPLDPGTLVVAVGGDGTVHEVALALVDRAGLHFSVIPMGTGNDLAAQLAIPRHVPTAIDEILGGTAIPWDVGLIGEHRFVNSVGFGFSAETSYWSQFTGPLRGNLRYGWAVLRAWLRHSGTSISFDGLDHSGEHRIGLMEIGIGDRCGGGYRLTAEAIPWDGLLDVCIIDDLSRWKMPRVVPRARRGRHLGHSSVHYQQVGSFRIQLARDTRIHVDGEIRELERGEHSVRIRPRALSCIAAVGSPLAAARRAGRGDSSADGEGARE
jgi:diacylglycerol kinase (ATP)